MVMWVVLSSANKFLTFCNMDDKNDVDIISKRTYLKNLHKSHKSDSNSPLLFSSEVHNADSEYSNSSLGNGSNADADVNVTKQLQMLTFKNPGKFMEDFDPERSAREMRKMNRRIYKEKIKKNQLYDENGIFLDNSQDLCDCLDTQCPGCHFPCARCGSEKCGHECRCSRKWYIEAIEIEGTSQVVKWPFSTPGCGS